MKWIKAFILICICQYNVNGQETTSFVLKFPKDYDQPGATVKLTLDSLTFFTTVRLNQTAEFKIPIKSSNANFLIEYSNIGFETKNWSGSYKLYGSEKADVLLNETGALTVKQWPKVEFEAVNAKADLKINGEIIGNTLCSKTLKPDVGHKIEWVQDNKVTCWRFRCK